ncbi:hypothetical protein T06_4892 [Trichinella sp. T6]|nr:hypothetical protein T06_4892 [Trichinella sp. T6]
MVFADISKNRTILAENCEHNLKTAKIIRFLMKNSKNRTIFADNS